MSVANELISIKSTLPENVKLVAVSKTKPEEMILEAYQTGHRAFGENKVQELVGKHENLPKDIEWHFIGHLQSNKVKYLAPFVHLIHGVDSLKLLQVIDKEAEKNNRLIDCLLQVKIAREGTKFGLSETALTELLTSADYNSLQYIRIRGVMGMATFSSDCNLVRSEFQKLCSIFNRLQGQFFSNQSFFSELSIGMSHDYQLAIEAGATMVRIGSSIFGVRNYKN